jgi:hypothetical protein
VALPRPAPQRRIFRPSRSTSWATRIFAVLVLVLAVGAMGAVVEVVLPQRVASLAGLEASEMVTARKSTSDVGAGVNTLWTELAAKGSMNLPNDRLTQDLATSQALEKSQGDALSHVQAAEAYITQTQAIPFQLHTPAFIATDRPALTHLEKALAPAASLAHAATLQLTIAQHMGKDLTTLANLKASLNSRDWAGASRTAASLATDVKAQQQAVADTEALVDPLWSKWMDAIITYAGAAQQYSLASASGQPGSARQFANQMSAANDQINATLAAAQGGAAAWQAKMVQPLITTMTTELAAGS